MNHIDRDPFMEGAWLVGAILLVINAPALVAIIAGALITLMLVRKVRA
jgi:hypothetical protein